VEVYERLDQVRSPETFLNFALWQARRAELKIRRIWRQETSLDAESDLSMALLENISPNYQTDLLNPENLAVINRALNRLSELEKKVFGLKYFSSFNDSEVAERLGLKVGNIRTILSRGRKKLRQDPELRELFGFTKDEIFDLRLDAAAPEKVVVGQVFDLAVTVRQPSSPLLTEDDLKQVKSGNVRINWPHSQPYVQLQIQVDAPDCSVLERDSYSFHLFAGRDAPVFYFHLIPKRQGTISVIVNLYQTVTWLSSARLRTTAREEIVGVVQIDVRTTGAKLSETSYVSENYKEEEVKRELADVKQGRLRVLERQAARYGIDCPAHITMEIEDLQKEIKQLLKMV
jgi:RNA polymerase sigma factor (sigma-70 family)